MCVGAFVGTGWDLTVGGLQPHTSAKDGRDAALDNFTALETEEFSPMTRHTWPET